MSRYQEVRTILEEYIWCLYDEVILCQNIIKPKITQNNMHHHNIWFLEHENIMLCTLDHSLEHSNFIECALTLRYCGACLGEPMIWKSPS